MTIEPNTAFAAPEDWRAYRGVLSRRVFAFVIDYAIVLLLCIPAAVVVFFLGIITLGLGFMLYPALFVIVALLYFGMTLGGPSQATPGMRMMGIALARVDGRRMPRDAQLDALARRPPRRPRKARARIARTRPSSCTQATPGTR